MKKVRRMMRRLSIVWVALLGLCATAAAAENGLVAHWDFNEGKGDVLHDRSGNNNRGKIHGARWVKCGDGYALEFDGIDDYVDCGDRKALKSGEPISMELWTYTEEVPYGETLLLGHDTGHYLLTYSGSAYPGRTYWHVAAAGKQCRAKAPPRLWHHIASTFDGANLRLYVDGVIASGGRMWKYTPRTEDTGFYVGGVPAVSGSDLRSFKGRIDSAKVYNRLLTRDEIFRHYKAGKPQHKNLPRAHRPAAASRVKVLNNMVAELLKVENPHKEAQAQYRFTNPRSGWVFTATDASLVGVAAVRVSLEAGGAQQAVIVHETPGESRQEAMRFLLPGEHKITVEYKGDAVLNRMVVRAIPELIYGHWPSNSIVSAFEPYSWDYLEKDVLRNATTIIISGLSQIEKIRPQFTVWHKQGRKWIAKDLPPFFDARTGRSQSAEDSYQELMRNPAMQHPLMDGVLWDPHDLRTATDNQYQNYASAIRRIRNDPAFKKCLYFYGDCLYGVPKGGEICARSIFDSGYNYLWAAYLNEYPTEAAARSVIETELVEPLIAWDSAFPGCLEHMIVTLCYMSVPCDRMNTEPDANFFVFMDMQCNALATHPALHGLAGVFWYKSHYASEEEVRWGGRLFRHYFIEGNTEMLSKDPYELRHIQNPDFNNGSEGWTLLPAEEGSIRPKYLDRYGYAQGRWLITKSGDNFLWTRRSAIRPNRFSQEIRDLEPGRLYSLKLYTADYKNLVERKSVKEKHAASIKLDGVELLPIKSFQHTYKNLSYHVLGPLDDDREKVTNWMNFHRVVFRAKRPTAGLTICDWASDDAPGGPTGQELMFNSIEIQPYIGD